MSNCYTVFSIDGWPKTVVPRAWCLAAEFMGNYYTPEENTFSPQVIIVDDISDEDLIIAKLAGCYIGTTRVIRLSVGVLKSLRKQREANG